MAVGLRRKDPADCRCACCGRRAVAILSTFARVRRRTGQDRFQHGDDRRGGAERQAASDRAAALARRRQCQGRAPRPAGRVRLLRRPEQSVECAWHLHQAHQRRQSRFAARSVRHQYGRGGDAGHRGKQQAHHQYDGGQHQPPFQLPKIFLDAIAWSGRGDGVLKGLFRSRGRAETEAADGRAPFRRRRVRQNLRRRCAR